MQVRCISYFDSLSKRDSAMNNFFTFPTYFSEKIVMVSHERALIARFGVLLSILFTIADGLAEFGNGAFSNHTYHPIYFDINQSD